MNPQLMQWYTEYLAEIADPIAAAILAVGEQFSCNPAMKQTNTEIMTPPQVAELMGVNPGKVLTWIRRGELRAVNVSQSFRPRYRITPEDLETFKRGRGVNPPPKRVRRSVYRGKTYY
jgi:excisionase family DNA binding protein